jgi:hypothetical protein
MPHTVAKAKTTVYNKPKSTPTPSGQNPKLHEDVFEKTIPKSISANGPQIGVGRCVARYKVVGTSSSWDVVAHTDDPYKNLKNNFERASIIKLQNFTQI